MVDKSEKVDTQKDKLIEEDFKQGEGAIQEDHLPPEQAGETEATGEEEKSQEPTAEEKLAELQDRYLRLSAEFDNFRKRTLKEKIELQRGANENLLFTLLPVADDFDRALQSIEEAKEMDAVREGLKLISAKFYAFLTQQGLKVIDAIHQDFDTDLHEAINKIPAPSKKLKGKVVDVVQKGYYLNEKVLRFAKVVIGD